MKILVPLIGGGLVMWYMREMLPSDTLHAVPLGAEYPDLIHFVAAVFVFLVLMKAVGKRKTSTP